MNYRYPVLRWAIGLTGLVVVLVVLNGGAPVGNDPASSRWAKVDLTQYCGKTVGELIDALGDDYLEYTPDLDFGYILRGFSFRYRDAVLTVKPDELKFCNWDTRDAEPSMENIRKEQIYSLKLFARKHEGR
jgi:hypothetical protein